ncbi:Protein of unknown function [Modicisalibacter ilicicola DSM 19980]|uniref:Uncharacterized protein n=1 Tax=Modicisalibacter ilicicola DSM 19980 TaxID=1121942 RepID=A0A1M4ZC07_9GAMM|nr:DUF1161 domain-containing protein [Halomonas ilicicola]SHF15583.1 Protein of unknown function [Halomonas ilicicola DSM 19980]
MIGKNARLTMALVMLALASPSWAQSSSSDDESPDRVRSTYKAATPGMSAPEDASRQQMRVAPMENAKRVASSDRRQEREEIEEMPQACKMLQAEIDRKISANDVVDYTVKVVPTKRAKEIVARNRDQPGKVEIVGNCGQGDYRVVYRRG